MEKQKEVGSFIEEAAGSNPLHGYDSLIFSATTSTGAQSSIKFTIIVNLKKTDNSG